MSNSAAVHKPLKKSLEDGSNPLSYITLSYMNQIYSVGDKKALEMEDLGTVSIQDDCGPLYVRFSQLWDLERMKPKEKRSLWMVLWRTVGDNTTYNII
jgi:hypothetical protein